MYICGAEFRDVIVVIRLTLKSVVVDFPEYLMRGDRGGGGAGSGCLPYNLRNFEINLSVF